MEPSELITGEVEVGNPASHSEILAVGACIDGADGHIET